MSAEPDPIADDLRANGFTEAADHLEQRRKDAQYAEAARRGPGETRPPGIRLLSEDPGEQARSAEAAVVAEALRRSGAGSSWVDVGPLMGEGRKR